MDVQFVFVGLTKNVERFFFLHVFGHSNSHLRSLMKNVEAPETKLGHLFVGFVGIVGLTVYSFRPLRWGPYALFFKKKVVNVYDHNLLNYHFFSCMF